MRRAVLLRRRRMLQCVLSGLCLCGVKHLIVITGASSGFGALTARALAPAGHTVYASMCDISGVIEIVRRTTRASSRPRFYRRPSSSVPKLPELLLRNQPVFLRISVKAPV